MPMVCVQNFADLDLTQPIFTDLEKLTNEKFKVSDICDPDWVKDYKKEFQ